MERNLITLYAPHLHYGEYDLKADLDGRIGTLDKQIVWAFHEFDDSTFSKVIAWAKGWDEDKNYSDIGKEFDQFVRTKYPGIDEKYLIENPMAIIGIQFYEDADKGHIGQILGEIALNAIENASGDDDTFDYMPGYVEAIKCLLEQMGFKEYAEEINTKLEKRTDDSDPGFEDEDETHRRLDAPDAAERAWQQSQNQKLK